MPLQRALGRKAHQGGNKISKNAFANFFSAALSIPVSADVSLTAPLRYLQIRYRIANSSPEILLNYSQTIKEIAAPFPSNSASNFGVQRTTLLSASVELTEPDECSAMAL